MKRHMLKSIKNVEYHPELQSYSMLCYFTDVKDSKYWMIPVSSFDPIAAYMEGFEVKGED